MAAMESRGSSSRNRKRTSKFRYGFISYEMATAYDNGKIDSDLNCKYRTTPCHIRQSPRKSPRTSPYQRTVEAHGSTRTYRRSKKRNSTRLFSRKLVDCGISQNSDSSSCGLMAMQGTYLYVHVHGLLGICAQTMFQSRQLRFNESHKPFLNVFFTTTFSRHLIFFRFVFLFINVLYTGWSCSLPKSPKDIISPIFAIRITETHDRSCNDLDLDDGKRPHNFSSSSLLVEHVWVFV